MNPMLGVGFELGTGWSITMTYRKAMSTFKLQDIWTPEHTAAFLNLKIALTSRPVLQAPKYNGLPFIITTDGCQEGLGAVLTQ